MVQAAENPAIRAERCIIFCLNCGRSTHTPTYLVEGLFGWLPYGRVTSRLHCRKGCGDRYGMVLPIDAPHPRIFAEKYDIQQPPQPPNSSRDIEAEMRDRLVEIGKGGTFLKVHAKAEDAAILHWGFDYLLKKLSEDGRQPPRLAVTRGAQWSRDSQRQYRIVEGQVVALGTDEKNGGW